MQEPVLSALRLLQERYDQQQELGLLEQQVEQQEQAASPRPLKRRLCEVGEGRSSSSLLAPLNPLPLQLDLEMSMLGTAHSPSRWDGSLVLGSGEEGEGGGGGEVESPRDGGGGKTADGPPSREAQKGVEIMGFTDQVSTGVFTWPRIENMWRDSSSAHVQLWKDYR